MRTNIDLDEDLLEEAFKVSDKTTKKDLVHEALELYVRIKKRRNLRDLKGKISFREGYDHKKLRQG